MREDVKRVLDVRGSLSIEAIHKELCGEKEKHGEGLSEDEARKLRDAIQKACAACAQSGELERERRGVYALPKPKTPESPANFRGDKSPRELTNEERRLRSRIENAITNRQNRRDDTLSRLPGEYEFPLMSSRKPAPVRYTVDAVPLTHELVEEFYSLSKLPEDRPVDVDRLALLCLSMLVLQRPFNWSKASLTENGKSVSYSLDGKHSGIVLYLFPFLLADGAKAVITTYDCGGDRDFAVEIYKSYDSQISVKQSKDLLRAHVASLPDFNIDPPPTIYILQNAVAGVTSYATNDYCHAGKYLPHSDRPIVVNSNTQEFVALVAFMRRSYAISCAEAAQRVTWRDVVTFMFWGWLSDPVLTLAFWTELRDGRSCFGANTERDFSHQLTPHARFKELVTTNKLVGESTKPPPGCITPSQLIGSLLSCWRAWGEDRPIQTLKRGLPFSPRSAPIPKPKNKYGPLSDEEYKFYTSLYEIVRDGRETEATEMLHRAREQGM